MKRLIEITEYSHKGISVTVHIDHLNAKVSLVENSDFANEEVTPKEWKFANRGLEYMKPWQNILDAMKYAIGEATKLLEQDLAESSKFKEQAIEQVLADHGSYAKPKKKHGGRK